MLNITDFFRIKLKAPLTNHVWSWGAETSDAVYLRCWQHEVKRVDGLMTVWVAGYSYPNGALPLGYKERLQQLEAIRSGKKSFVVMCIAKDPTGNAAPGGEVIASYNERELFIGGELLSGADGRVLLTLTNKKAI